MTLPPLFQQNLFNSKYKEEPTMSSNVRPATMERITTPALAESFIDQQLAELRQQIGDKKVLLALSGGVDSSVAAYLMKEKGYECIGITIKTFNETGDGIKRENTCCSLDDVSDARSVACTLGIRHFLYNFTGQFEEHVMKRFVDAYENGCTPNPCIDCNRYIKFQELYERAKLMGYDIVVTGHYARVEYNEVTGRYLLKKG